MGKIGYSISIPIIPSHSHALSHFHGGTVVLPIPMGIPWDPRDPWKFPRLTNNSLRKCVSLIGHALTIEVLLSIDSTQKYFYSQRMTNEENALHRTNLLLQHQWILSLSLGHRQTDIGTTWTLNGHRLNFANQVWVKASGLQDSRWATTNIDITNRHQYTIRISSNNNQFTIVLRCQYKHYRLQWPAWSPSSNRYQSRNRKL